MNDMGKNLLLWLVIAAVLLVVFNNFGMRKGPDTIEYSNFIEHVNGNQVRWVQIDGLTITGELYDGQVFETIQPQVTDQKLLDDLYDHEVKFEGKKPEQQSIWTQLIVASFPILIIIAVFMFFMRQMQGGASGRGGPLTFGKSKAKLSRHSLTAHVPPRIKEYSNTTHPRDGWQTLSIRKNHSTLPILFHSTNVISQYQLYSTLPILFHSTNVCSQCQLYSTLPTLFHITNFIPHYQFYSTVPM